MLKLIVITVKDDVDPEDLLRLHPRLILIAADFIDYAYRRYGILLTISSILRPKTTDSGVHERGRGIDFSRHQYLDNGLILASIPEKDCNDICVSINHKYPRDDGHETIKWHDSGSGFHFHLQVPYDPKWNANEIENQRISRARAA